MSGIRQAVSDDAETLERLYRELVPRSTHIHVLPERLAEIRRDPNNFVFVYDAGESLLGSVAVTLCLDAMYALRPYSVVENLIVTAGARGKGIGGKLLGYVEDVAVARGCTKIMLLSTASREAAHAFFTRRGYNGEISRGFKKYLPLG